MTEFEEVWGGAASTPTLVSTGRLRFEYEDLDGEVWVDVVVAHKADHLAPGQLFDLLADVGLHDALPASAQIKHGLALAGVRERLLAACKAVLEHDEDAVFAERGLRFGRAAAGCAGERSHHRVRDHCGELAVGERAIGAHRRAPSARAARSALVASLYSVIG